MDRDRDSSETLAGVTGRIADRARSISGTAADIDHRVAVLETDLAGLRGEVRVLGVAFASLDGKVDQVLDESKEQRRERMAREQRLETRAAAELDWRRDRTLRVLAIVVPTITAIAALVAALAGREPAYPPAPRGELTAPASK